jgi:hypothetical protein
VELILIAAAVAAGTLLIVLGRRGRTRTPEGSVFDAHGGSSIHGRKASRPRAPAAGGRLADLGLRQTSGPAPGPGAQEPAQPAAGPAGDPTPKPPADKEEPERDLAPPPPTPPAPAPSLGETPAPAWPVAAPPPDWSHTLAQPTAWSSPAGSGLDRELAEAKERAERAERALQAERREREERERRSGGT